MSHKQLVEKQRHYFNSHATQDVEFRKEQLRKLRDLINDNMDKLSESIYKDIKRGKKYSMILEIMGALSEIDYMIDNLDKWTSKDYKERTLPYTFNGVYTIRQPIGVVLLLAPWNYPLGLILLPLVPAIAAGNTIIIKPSELAANTSKCIATLFKQYFNEEYIAVVEGGVPETSSLLQEKFDHIFYTGSAQVGKIIMEAAAKHLSPVTLELGGKCPVVICDDTNIDLAAKRVAWGKWMNCGQTCIAPDYVMVTKEVKPKFVESVKKYLLQFYGNNPQNHDDYPRIINQKHFQRLSALVDKSRGTILYEIGQRDESDMYIPPIIMNVERDDELMKDEIFGPIMPILDISHLNEAIEVINSGERPLAAYLFTNDQKKINQFLGETISGQCTVNDVVIQFCVDTLPFGGIGSSGMGRYTGKYGFETFSHEKAVFTSGFIAEPLFASRYPPVTDSKIKQLKFLVGYRVRFPEKEIIMILKIFLLALIGIGLGILIQKYGKLI